MSNVYAVDVNPIIYQGGPEGKSFFMEADKADPIPARGGGSRSPALFGVLKLPIHAPARARNHRIFTAISPLIPCDSLALAPSPGIVGFSHERGERSGGLLLQRWIHPPGGGGPPVYSCSHSSRAASSSTVIRAANASASASTSWIDFELER